jgi:hypothetical protein
MKQDKLCPYTNAKTRHNMRLATLCLCSFLLGLILAVFATFLSDKLHEGIREKKIALKTCETHLNYCWNDLNARRECVR